MWDESSCECSTNDLHFWLRKIKLEKIWWRKLSSKGYKIWLVTKCRHQQTVLITRIVYRQSISWYQGDQPFWFRHFRSAFTHQDKQIWRREKSGANDTYNKYFYKSNIVIEKIALILYNNQVEKQKEHKNQFQQHCKKGVAKVELTLMEVICSTSKNSTTISTTRICKL